ncbi:MAG: methionyl-tRNA formyltransferase [Rhodobacteraceae bacterium]|nr:methionyl-tRNA formyltransferase [Paracoccaceae bacterium]
MRIVFMGTPDFSVTALDALIADGHEIVAVYSQPPRPAGRGKKLRPSPVQKRAEALGIEVRTPLNFKKPEDIQSFTDLSADIGIVVAYGLILPQVILDGPRLGCLNIHASLLPRWRGAAPIQRAIMAGDAETGVCIMQMEAGLDTGPVFTRETTPITVTDTAGVLHDRLAEIGGSLVCATLRNINKLNAEPQIDSDMTYAAKINKSESKIDWTRPAVEIDRQIRGLSPFPGAWTEIAGERVKLLNCVLMSGEGSVGTALDDALLIACGQGAVRLTRLQRAGKGPMDAVDFLRGFPVATGDLFVP